LQIFSTQLYPFYSLTEPKGLFKGKLINTKATFDQAKFSNALRTLLSSYTRAIQKQENMTGSLFQQNSKTKELHTNQYALTCFHYIHQNPLRAGLINSIQNWEHQSFKEYWKGTGEICNILMGRELLDISSDPDQFLSDSIKMIPEKQALELF